MNWRFRAAAPMIYLLAASCGPEPTSNPHRFELAPDGETLLMEGRWNSSSAAYSAILPRSNSVHLECNRTAGVCTEFVAQLVTKSDEAAFREPALHTLVLQYRIVEWGASRLVARAETRAYYIEIRVSVSDRSAERTARETLSRGAAGAEPSSVLLWTLE